MAIKGIKGIAYSILKFARKNSTKLLTGMALFGLGTSVSLAIKDTPKAQLAVDRLKDELPEGQKPTKTDILKAALPAYGRTIVSTLVTAGCIIGGEFINEKQKAQLIALCTASEIALGKLENKTRDIFGAEGVEDIQAAIAKDDIAANPVSKSNVIITGHGDSLIYDSWSGRYFVSDIEYVRRAVNGLNAEVIQEMWASVNDFYDFLNIPDIEAGSECGWNVDHRLDVVFSTQMADDGRPCLVIEYVQRPIHYRSYN